MKKLKLLVITSILPFGVIAQTSAKTNQKLTLNFQQSVESEVVSEELNLKYDSIVIESFIPETEEWERVGKYKYGTEETANRKESLFYAWNDSTEQWKSFPTQVWEYNEEGNLTYHVIYSGSRSVNGLNYNYKKESIFTYSGNGKLAEITEYQKDYSTNELIPNKKEEITTNSQEKQIHYVLSQWDKTLEKWVFIRQYEYDYDENGFKTLDIDYFWLKDSEEWYGASKSEYEFDEKGNKLLEINYVWNQDSKDWIESGKVEIAYDESGNVTEKIWYSLDYSEKVLVYSSREEFGYDEQGNMIFQFYSQWDATLKVWVNLQKMEVEFDENFNQTLQSSYHWSTEDSIWIGASKTGKEFDINGNLLATIEYQWDWMENQWTELFKEKYEYDSLENRTLTSLYVWSDADKNWVFSVNRTLSEYEYDENGRILKQIISQWNEDSGNWDLANKNEYEYDEQGRQISHENAWWNPTYADWENLTKTVYDFDEAGHYILDGNYVWDTGLSNWRIHREYRWAFDAAGRQTINSFLEWGGYGNIYWGNKLETNYNENGRTLMRADYGWDTDAGEWKGATKTEYTYDDYGDYGRNLVTLWYIWNQADKKWQYDTRETCYYSTGPVQDVVEINAEINVKVYPNPAENVIRVQLPNSSVPAQLELFNLSGQKILSAQIFDGELISVSHFKPGIYSWRIIQNKEIFTGKFVKK